ncbi:hypothetical protein V6N13_009836 [Hibiscus sabdariffa]
MRLRSWNVRGLGSTAKRKSIQHLLRRQRCVMAFLQETKMEEISDKIVKQRRDEDVRFLPGESRSFANLWRMRHCVRF